MANDDAPPSETTPGSQSPRRNRIRNQTRRDSILRGLRAGGLLATVIAGAWAWWQAWRNPGMLGLHSSGLDPLSLSFILLLAAATVWAFCACIVEPADSPRPRRTLLLAALLVLIPSTIAVVLLGRYWWQRSQAIGLPYPVLSQLAVVSAGIGVTVTAGLLLHLERGSRTPSKQLLRRRPTRTTTAVAVLTIAVATIALMLPGLTFTARSIEVSGLRPASVPNALGEQILWQRAFDTNESDSFRYVVSGTTGPIVITEHGAQGLDPHTGETTWSYTRPASTFSLCGYNHDSGTCYAAMSPNHAHMVLAYHASFGRTLFVGINTTTGHANFEYMHHSSADTDPAQYRRQITDHVFVSGPEIISLADGSQLATLPEVTMPSCDGHSSCFTPPVLHDPSNLQGGHSTLILGAYCPNTVPMGPESIWCEMAVAPDDDLTAITTVNGILPTVNDGPVVANGWTVRLHDPDAANQEISEQLGTSHSRPVDAVSLDALSGADNTAPIPLGDLIQPLNNNGSCTLTVQGASSTEVVFDPATGQVNTTQELTERAYGPGYLNTLTVEESKEISEQPDGSISVEYTGIDIHNADNKVAMHLDYADLATDNGDIISGDSPVPAPGVVTLVYDRAVVDDNDGTSKHQTVVVGLG
ncbi:hypothetical protein DRB06_12085 [Actinomyces sp. Z5]|uniref:hypothetical protein n=1 Tax=Actinomyces sp. Z5 TaxID=2250216 RepID=UPI000DCD36D8|nr:hypothetical protein [Actinomyces sp. Z5]RAX19647.1 hypothetical protein DRB06_12085 [Actinomyces sp. Z5]